MPSWWTYEPSNSYTARQSRIFTSYAGQVYARESMRQQLQQQGVDPDLIPSLDTNLYQPGAPPYVNTPRGTSTPPQPDTTPVSGPTTPIEHGGGGLLGKITGAAGDVLGAGAETVSKATNIFGEAITAPTKALNRIPGYEAITSPIFGGPVEQPWDVLRPLKRALDAEVKHVGEPTYKYGVVGAATLPIAIQNQTDPISAFNEAKTRYEQRLAGGTLESLGSNILVPSNFIPIDEAAKLPFLAATKVAPRLAELGPLAESLVGSITSSRALMAAWEGEQGGTRLGRGGEELSRFIKDLTPEQQVAVDRLAFGTKQTSLANLSDDELLAKHDKIMDSVGYWANKALADLKAGDTEGAARAQRNLTKFADAIDPIIFEKQSRPSLGSTATPGSLPTERPNLPTDFENMDKGQLRNTIAQLREAQTRATNFGNKDVVDYYASLEDRAQYILRNPGKLPPMSGGAPDPAAIVKIFQRMNDKGVQGEYVAKSVNDLLDWAAANATFTQNARATVARYLPENIVRILEQHNFRLVDSPLDVFLGDYNRIRNFGTNKAVLAPIYAKAGVTEAGIQQDANGLVTNLADLVKPEVAGKLRSEALATGQSIATPHFHDLVEGRSVVAFDDLKPEVQAAIDKALAPTELVAKLEEAFGIKAARIKTPSGRYVARNVTERPVNVIDPRDESMLSRLARGEDIPESAKITEQQGTGSAVKTRYGAKQAFQKQRSIDTVESGMAQGIKYMPFEQSQQARVEQGFNRIADTWLGAATRPYSKAPTELLDPALKLAAETNAKKVADLARIDRAVSYARQTGAYQGFITPKLSKDADPVLQELIKSGVEGSSIRQKAGRIEAMTNLQQDIKAAQTEATRIATGTKARRTQALADIRAGGTPDYPRQFQGRYYPEQPGAQIQKSLNGLPANGILENSINKVNNFVRPIMAGFDASMLGVQGLLGLSDNPAAYLKAARYSMLGGSDQVIQDMVASGVADSALKSGVHLAGRNDIGEFMLSKALGKVGEPFNNWFNNFGNVLRLKMYEGGMGRATRGLVEGGPEAEKALRDLARNVNLATGFSPGKVTSLETAATFAPRFFRSQLGLVSDALTRGDIAGAKAREQLIKLITLGSIATYGINEALGNKTDLNPTSPNFMRIRALGHDISVFGVWDSLAKAAILSAQGVATGQPFKGPQYLVRAKASPAIGRLYDVLKGETYSGTKLDWSSPQAVVESLGREASQFLPIAGSQAFEKGVPTTPGEVGGAAVQLLGTKATPLSGAEELQIRRDEAAQKQQGKDWNQLQPFEQYQLQQQNADLQPLHAQSDIGKALEARRAIGDTINTQQQVLDAAVPLGPQWVDAYKKLRDIQSGRYQQWEQQNPDAAQALANRIPADDNQAALDAYYKAFNQSKTPWGTTDVDALTTALDALQSSWTPEQTKYVDQNTGYKVTPVVQQYRAMQRQLGPYYQIERTVWGQYRQNPELAKYTTLDLYLDAKAFELRKLGVPDNMIPYRVTNLPVVKSMAARVSGLQQRYRLAHPEADRILVQLRGLTPIRLQKGISRSPYSSIAGAG